MNIHLTPRETEVLGLVGQGFDNPDICRQLCISGSTAEAHIHRIREKLERAGEEISPNNRGALVRWAIVNGYAPTYPEGRVF